MDKQTILKHVDHTLLLQDATWGEIRQICDDAIAYKTASICIPPGYVKQAKEYVQDKMAVCTVIGFPNGYMTTAAKEFETKDALANGADEIDMVINIGWVKDGKYDSIEEEIRTLKAACAQVLGLRSFEDETFSSAITAIDACPDNLLRFHFRDGHRLEFHWRDRSRRESWTDEMRETARQRALAGR